MQYLSLNGKWKMRKMCDVEFIPAQVPGSVMCDYLRENKIPDPFWRENEKFATGLFENDFEYLRKFQIPAEFLQEECIELVCRGLDTLADIYINGRKISSVNNMHRTWRFDIKSVVTAGENEIRVCFFSPNAYIREKYEAGDVTYSTDENMSGANYLRKVHCQFGWDWGPKIPDAGIWRDIGIEAYSVARLDDVYITQKHLAGRVDLDIKLAVRAVNLRKFLAENISLDAELTIVTPDGSRIEKKLEVDEFENYYTIAIENPQLWWPHGYGQHPLYQVSINLRNREKTLDTYCCRIGLRTMTVSTETDEWGSEFAFTVNSVKIFAMGADYIPEDSMFTTICPERTRKLLEDCVKANFNSIRVWGGGYYPDDFFYDICDELGLIVWQDLMFACNVYVLTKDFAENIEKEVRENVRRIRHHACLGLWCGNNEMELGWVEWDDVTCHSKKLKADYIKMFEVLIPKAVKETDPNTFYWLASPSSGGSFDDPNNENHGDVHYWDVWHGLKPFTEYRKYYFRFCSEFGFESFPEIRTIETFAEERDYNIFSPVMEAHQKRTGGNGKILYYISETYRYPKDFTSLIYISQVLQMESIKYGVEHWRRHRGRCMGAIYWQLNDCWPVASWASIDYYGRWKALHYGAKRFFAPILATILDEGKNIRIFTHNESMDDKCGCITVCLKSKNFDVLSEARFNVKIPRLSAQEVFQKDYSSLMDTVEKERSTFLECFLEIDGEQVCKQVTLFVAPKAFEFSRPNYGVAVTEGESAFGITLTADTYTRFLQIKIIDEDCIFSDNYFDITGPEGVTVYVDKRQLKKTGYTAVNLKEAIELLSVGDTY